MSISSSGAEKDASHVFTWVLASVICVVLFALLFWVLGPGRASQEQVNVSGDDDVSLNVIPTPTGMTWPPLTIDANRIERAREAERRARQHSLDELVTRPPIQEFYATVKELNDHQFITQPIPSKTPSELEHNFNASLGEVLAEIEPSEFMTLGEPLFEECEAGLEALLKDLATGKTSIQDAKEDADFEDHERYRKHCGNMLTQLHELGLVDDRGAWTSEDARTIASILERYRWAYLVHLHVKPLDLLTPPERVAYLRWRLETDAFDLEQRKHFAATLPRDLPSYPQGVPEAMLAYEEGEKRRAAEILSRYKNRSPQDATYRIMYDALQKELDTQ